MFAIKEICSVKKCKTKHTCVRGSTVVCFFVQFFSCLIRGVLVFAPGGLILLRYPGFPLSLKTHAFTKHHFDQEHRRRRTTYAI